MILEAIDFVVLGAYFAAMLAIGLWAARKAGKNTTEYFLSGRSMPWWLLGMSMVATTFSTDTPNLVADITRKNGVAGNWVWWAFLLTGMLTVFVYARLWRRSGVTTDVEFYELRYSGKSAAFLRGFRAIYLGVFFNVMVMAAVTLAAIKIGGVLFNASPFATVAVASVVTVIISAVGGLRSVVLTDLLLFVVAMVGSVIAAVVAVGDPRVGGLSGLVTHPNVADKLSIEPDFSDPALFIPLFLVPLAVQWWASWYPGSEPGGGGYVAQRMLAARNEDHAVGATFFFNAAHYALRPWPWILVALASLVIFPDLESLARAFPHVDPSILNDDLAYPAMLTLLPHGLLGLVVASLAAAFMSTVSTHLNWGASYITHDVYRRFVSPEADERQLVRVGRWSTVVLMLLAALLALALQNALQAFQILLQIGAGTGLLFILRWFWWRINAWSELVAMVASFLVAVGFLLSRRAGWNQLESWQELVIGVAVTTVCWLGVTFASRPTEEATLRRFYRLTRPGGPGWKRVVEAAHQEGQPIEATGRKWGIGFALAAMVAGSMAIYGSLFAVGDALFGNWGAAAIKAANAFVAACALFVFWDRLRNQPLPEPEDS